MPHAAIASVCFVILLAACGCGRSHSNSASRGVDLTAGGDLLPLDPPLIAEPQIDTVGIMFCLDVSGSMESSVDQKPKIEISKEAMQKVFDQIDRYRQSNPNKKVHVGLVAFSSDARLALPLLPFEKDRLVRETNALHTGGGTAIGDAILLALQELHKSGVETRAIIVMSDGDNNRGREPEQVMQAIRENRNSLKSPTDDVSVFLVAFDIESQVFERVQQAGASVVESRNEASLQAMLNTVVEEVLLEKQ